MMIASERAGGLGSGRRAVSSVGDEVRMRLTEEVEEVLRIGSKGQFPSA